jgi:uncharacterized protein (TIGR00270 family)
MVNNEITCEICGNPIYQKMYRLVEGVKMLVCPSCAELGEKLPERPTSNKPYNKRVDNRKEPPKMKMTNKPVYDAHGFDPSRKIADKIKEKKIGIEDLELKPDYRKVLIKLRQNKNLSQIEFANSVGLSESTYKAVEAKKIDLTIMDAQKIEKKYEIKLTQTIGEQEEQDMDYAKFSSKKSGDFTLGDVLFGSKKK